MATGGKLENLTQSAAVERAMEEFRVLGRDAFIEKYGFKPSRDFFVHVHRDQIDLYPGDASCGRQ